jgi:hypothetical protein
MAISPGRAVRPINMPISPADADFKIGLMSSLFPDLYVFFQRQIHEACL